MAVFSTATAQLRGHVTPGVELRGHVTPGVEPVFRSVQQDCTETGASEVR